MYDSCDSDSASLSPTSRAQSWELGKGICRCGSCTLNCFQSRCLMRHMYVTVGEAKLWMCCEREGLWLRSPTLAGSSLQVVQLWSETSEADYLRLSSLSTQSSSRLSPPEPDQGEQDSPGSRVRGHRRAAGPRSQQRARTSFGSSSVFSSSSSTAVHISSSPCACCTSSRTEQEPPGKSRKR